MDYLLVIINFIYTIGASGTIVGSKLGEVIIQTKSKPLTILIAGPPGNLVYFSYFRLWKRYSM